jgi:hypothetical protein
MTTRQGTTREGTRAWKRRRWQIGVAIALLVLLVLGWALVDRRETRRLGENTRIVVRFPAAAIDQLAPHRIEEQIPIDEVAGKLEVTGTANAIGHVQVEIHPHAEPGQADDAMILVQVTGETDNQLIGRQSQVKIVGDGRGTFRAFKRVHFDGLSFDAGEETHVEATHETDIVEIEPEQGVPLQGAVRLMASRKARAALPQLNAIAAGRIEEIVRSRMDELVNETVQKLNQINRLDDTVARLHPKSDQWRIAVAARDGFVQAALVPAGGRTPQLPEKECPAVEVWMRLTRTQRTGINLISQWKQSHRLYRRFVSDEQADRLADEATVANVDGWTRIQIGLQSLDRRTTSTPSS